MPDDPHSPEIDPSAPSGDARSAPGWAGPLSGFVAGAAAIATGLLVAAVIDVATPLDAVGSEFIDNTPKWLKTLAIDWFGTNDKTALRVGMVITIALLSLMVGWAARRRPVIGPIAMAIFGAGGALIAVGRPGDGASAAVPALVGAVVGATSIWYLIALVRRGDAPTEVPGPSRAPNGWDRRRFMVTTGGAAGVTVVAAAVAKRIENVRLDDVLDSVPATLPPVATEAVLSEVVSAAPDVPASATLSPISPYLTPNDDFYLIDTALSVPRIRLSDWRVEIGGMVDRPLTLTYADLLARPQVERIITLSCVSNEVGGNLVGNAVWQGVLLSDLLDEAGVQTGAEQVFSTSVDGWTCGFPVAAAMDGRDTMIAIGMNGEPLPLRHGFPARLVVPGLYGYVSATKWLQQIELTTWDAAEGYWVPRGWSKDGPIKTQSRLDVPKRGDDVIAGTVAIAGVAWAPHRGIIRVEVRVDDGPWQEARLGDDVSSDAWRQWVLEWDATSGKHTLQVRATDGDGNTQTEQVSRPDPDGATGWHTRTVTVT
ncbi:MAG: molybdopterin-dependent oxidoreductase [Ilumatobacteraceae bacterium]